MLRLIPLTILLASWVTARPQSFNIDQEPVYYSLKKALRNPERVYKLDLAENELTNFPTEIFQLTELRFLKLDSNRLSAVPPGIAQLNKLESIGLSHNKLDSLPKEFGHLQELYYVDLSRNRLTALPEAVCMLPNLELLHIHNNNRSWDNSNSMLTVEGKIMA